jgi:acetate kinase
MNTTEALQTVEQLDVIPSRVLVGGRDWPESIVMAAKRVTKQKEHGNAAPYHQLTRAISALTGLPVEEAIDFQAAISAVDTKGAVLQQQDEQLTAEEAETLHAVWAGDAFDAKHLETAQPKLEAIAGMSWQ